MTEEMHSMSSGDDVPQFSGPSRMVYFWEVARLNPPIFDGGINMEAAENWLNRMERIFKVLEVPGEFQVRIATYYLKKMALAWWNTLRPTYTNEDSMEWKDFTCLFWKRFNDDNYRDSMIQSFNDLKQGSMTVLEYYDRFLKLMRYSEGASEYGQVHRFQASLRPRLLQAVAINRYTTLQAVFEAAQRVERVFDETQGTYEERTARRDRKMMRHNQGKAPSQGSSAGHSANNRSRPSGGVRYTPYACFSCGEVGHKKRDCPHDQQGQPQQQHQQQAFFTPQQSSFRPAFGGGRGFVSQSSRQF